MEMVERRFSWLAVVTIVLVSISVYTCSFLAGVALGRALERRNNLHPSSINGAVDDDTEYSVLPGRRSSSSSWRMGKKVGPWGGSGGWHDFGIGGRSSRSSPVLPRQLNSIVLYHSRGAIHSLYYDYYIQLQPQQQGRGGGGHDELKLVKNGPWGQKYSFDSIAVRETIKLSDDEQLIAMEGTFGHFRDVVEPVITSLTFRTNAGRTYGPYGGGESGSGTPFSVPAEEGRIIVGFWGRAGWLLDSIGVYVRRER
ncbi:salt stress-induced protein-like [Oryza glaberrima]|uniref:Jacalin-type lectin domain-containing protein n=1 Tax=Oryza glaberrima TaxID=4538 RepID=I1PIS8_ORYGL|nr:salt stress-induced protein-like [Oryza glaberrima]